MLAVLVLTAAAGVRAQGEQGWIELAVAGSADERAALQRSLSELLGRLHLGLYPQGTRDDAPLASARIELDELECRITLTGSGPEAKVLMFRRIARKGSTQVMAETVALIVHGAVEELLQAPRHPVASTAPPEPEPPLPPPPSAASRLSLDLAGFAGSRAFGGGASLVVAAGATASVGLQLGRWHPALWLSAAYNTPFEANTELLRLHAEVLSFRAGPSLRLLERDDWYLEGGLGAGADLFFTDARSAVLPPERVGHDRIDAAPIGTALLAGHLSLASRVDLFLGFTLDVDLAPRRYVADLPTGRETVYEPWRVRPALVLGFDFSAIKAGGEP